MATISSAPAAGATAVVEALPRVMGALRGHVRRHRPAGLSLLQLQALAVVRREAGCSLSALAEQLGLSLPTASKLVATLVRRGFAARAVARTDRRRRTLRLTAAGRAAIGAAHRLMRGAVARALARIPAAERAAAVRGVRILAGLFPPAPRRPEPGRDA